MGTYHSKIFVYTIVGRQPTMDTSDVLHPTPVVCVHLNSSIPCPYRPASVTSVLYRARFGTITAKGAFNFPSHRFGHRLQEASPPAQIQADRGGLLRDMVPPLQEDAPPAHGSGGEVPAGGLLHGRRRQRSRHR